MKYFLPALATFLGICFIPLHEAWPAQNGSDSGLYEWTDEGGTLNFSDNPLQIQGKYRKGAKKRESISGEVLPSQVQEKDTEKHRSANPAISLYGDHDENWWRSKFSGLHAQLKRIKDALPVKYANLREAHINMDASRPTKEHSNQLSNRDIYKLLSHMIKADEERVTALEKELAGLDTEASRAGVPLDWRK